MKSRVPKTVFACVLTLGLLASARPAFAEGFISPLVGFNFGGDSGCLRATGCENKNLNLGVSIGSLGTVFGFEEEISYAKDFSAKPPINHPMS